MISERFLVVSGVLLTITKLLSTRQVAECSNGRFLALDFFACNVLQKDVVGVWVTKKAFDAQFHGAEPTHSILTEQQ